MISWVVLAYHVRSLDKSRYHSGNEWRSVCDIALTLRVWALGGKNGEILGRGGKGGWMGVEWRGWNGGDGDGRSGDDWWGLQGAIKHGHMCI